MREQDESLGVSDGTSTHGNATPTAKHAESLPDIKSTISEIDENGVAPADPSELEVKRSRYTKEVASHQDDNLEYDKNIDFYEENDHNNIEVNSKSQTTVDKDSEIELERELHRLFLGNGWTKKEPGLSKDSKPKIGAAKAKRQKKAEKQAALEAEGKLPPKPLKNRKPYDPSAAMQKARGETVVTGRRNTKK